MIEENTENKDFKFPKKKTFFLFTIIFCFILLIMFTTQIFFTSDDSLFSDIKKFGKEYIFYSINAAQEKVALKGEENDRINILLLGIGGKGHAGGTLTDTIILASYKPSTKEVTLTSIPRDLIVYIPNYAWRKVNHLYYFGEQELAGNGGEFTISFISQLADLPIHYYVMADFNGFSEIVDALDGIDILVDNIINDPLYPIPGKENAMPIESRYEHLYIEKGLQHMDGELALKYARSRHSSSVEGNDYARSKRQQKTLSAIKEKTLSFNTFLNPGKIGKLIDITKEYLKTNLTTEEILRLISFARQFDANNIKNIVLDTSPEGPLKENHYNGGFVLETKTGDFEELQFIIKNCFDEQKEFDINKRKPVEMFSEKKEDNIIEDIAEENNQQNKLPQLSEKLTVEIRNGTFISGLAKKFKTKMQKNNFSVEQIGNAEKQNYTKTYIYNNTGFELSTSTIDYFNITFKNPEILPEISPNITPSANNILIILGADIFY